MLANEHNNHTTLLLAVEDSGGQYSGWLMHFKR
jgi:hypothetical protein